MVQRVDGGLELLTDHQRTLFGRFYSTARVGAVRLSDGGGPFGFDFLKAIIVDELIAAYGCDAFIETGSYFGDTTSYMGHAYSDLPIWSCDIDPTAVHATTLRTRHLPNVFVTHEASTTCIARAVETFRCPFYYLDAHWYEWPLTAELQQISRGVVAVDDFDIGDDRFAFDSYDGIRCDARLVSSAYATPPPIYCVDPDIDPLVPCLQIGRRSGTAYVPVGLPAAFMTRLRWMRDLSASEPKVVPQEDRCV